jgi:sterol desaturase/sphingolipid hydroxylase (fatty acid hydroxylase superfamily)
MLEFASANIIVLVYVLTLAIMWTWESLAPFFQNPRDKIRHDLRNLIIGAVNAVLLGTVFASFTASAASYVSEYQIGFLFWLSSATWLHAVLAFLVVDCWTYTWHRINHLVSFLWRFHRVHHSDSAMDATTAARFHIGEITFSMMLRLLLVICFGIPLFVLVAYDITLLVTTMFHHANIALPAKIDRLICLVTPSPFMHKVHHSRYQPETDSNFSSVLSVWDRLFGTYREKENHRKIRLGLDGFDDEKNQTVKGLIATPFYSQS